MERSISEKSCSEKSSEKSWIGFGVDLRVELLGGAAYPALRIKPRADRGFGR
jgi:hypothetical protein